MTAQIPDTLTLDGSQYLVRGFISLPPGVEEPPEQIQVESTDCWRGYLCRWAVEALDGESHLFLMGFETSYWFDESADFYPLHEPVMNPLTGKVRVSPQGAECLYSVHMGFETKFAGERNFVFERGKLVDVQPIPDSKPNPDGLLDIVKLHPPSDEVGQQRLKNFITGTWPSVPKGPYPHVCPACGTEFTTEGEGIDQWPCHGCARELRDVGRHFTRWAIKQDESEGTVMLSHRPGKPPISAVNPQWYRKRRLLGIAWLRFIPGKTHVTLEAYGSYTTRWLKEPETGSYPDHHKLASFHEGLSALIAPIFSDREGLKVKCDYRCTFSRELKVETPAIRRGSKLDAPAIAKTLEDGLEAAVTAWKAELIEVLPRFRQAHRRAFDQLTRGTGIYPPDPAQLTPTDRSIMFGWKGVVEKLCSGGSTWVTPPKHTETGWQRGELVRDRYLTSLNV